MASQKLPSLSRKLLLAFIKSFILPLTLVAIGAFYLFSGYQYQGLKAQAQNNTRLISAYLANYIDDIDDIKLFVYEESYGISKESHWREAINAKVMGAMILNWQEKRWQRFFNSEEPGNIEPVYMLEKVENQNHAKWEVHNFTMGYQRQVTEDTYEYLLLNGEESFNDLGEPEWLFSRALGVDIPLTSLHIIG